MKDRVDLSITKRTDSRLLERMAVHYSKPRGFVGRSICYSVSFRGEYYGHIVGGSATLHLPGRHAYLGTKSTDLNSVVSNIFFNVSPVEDGRYPIRNFTSSVVQAFVSRVQGDWLCKYGDVVVGFETLVQLPRSGELYRRAGWALVGKTKGYTCKRKGSALGVEAYTGLRVWQKAPEFLKPKFAFCLRVDRDA